MIKGFRKYIYVVLVVMFITSINPAASTILDGASCISIGTWDEPSKTCAQ